VSSWPLIQASGAGRAQMWKHSLRWSQGIQEGGGVGGAATLFWSSGDQVGRVVNSRRQTVNSVHGDLCSLKEFSRIILHGGILGGGNSWGSHGRRVSFS